MSITTQVEAVERAISESWPRFIRRAIVFIAVGTVLYIALLAAMSATDWQGASLLVRNTSFFVSPGGETFTSQRFREAELHTPVDILFCGSSRAYLSFDPRPFQHEGIATFNIGSSGQTPLNTYFMLKRYLPRMKPRIVAMEVYYVTLGLDGVECYYDLLANSAFHRELAEMCQAVQSPKAYNATLGVILQRAGAGDFGPPEQAPSQNRRYIGEGFVTTDEQSTITFGDGASPIEVKNEQVDYLRKSLELVKSQGAEAVLVIPPIPKESIRSISNYDEVRARVEALARRESVKIYDFGQSMNLDSHKDFFDASHVNATGAAAFSRAFCDSLMRDYSSELGPVRDSTIPRAWMVSLKK